MRTISWVWRPCKRCGKVLHRDEFPNHRGSKGRKYPRPECAPCRALGAAEWRTAHPEYAPLLSPKKAKTPEQALIISLQHTARRLKIPFSVLEEAYKSQKGLCACCKRSEDVIGRKSRLHAHHNHETGKFIAFLCQDCNIAEGYLGGSAQRAYDMYLFLSERD